ncbi:MAG: hypothetical protein HOJ95_05480 [Nitrospinaceae bacterium]|jgi:hypothetical protein|nr:hypothetical protein [Nitrospinaceae bacterium]MBT3823235.1 hypothetical protein [Nitrospinaceae bacterium]MBT6394135.1 hypothetical protein [Nitrospinaceae bacterium]
MMAYTFSEFCADCNRALKTDSGEAGRLAVQKHFDKILLHTEFVNEHLGENPPPGRHIIFVDKETDMNVMVHIMDKDGFAVPHDHGPYWVIYGNATGYTDMTEFNRLDDGSKEGYAELEVSKEYRINPGDSSVYDVGDIHSIDYPANTMFIRLTSGDVESGQNLSFSMENKTVEIQDRSKQGRVTSRVSAKADR